jgi:hypothetical protein
LPTAHKQDFKAFLVVTVHSVAQDFQLSLPTAVAAQVQVQIALQPHPEVREVAEADMDP